MRTAKREAKAAAGLILASELKSRRRVLRRLGCGCMCCQIVTNSSQYAYFQGVPVQQTEACSQCVGMSGSAV